MESDGARELDVEDSERVGQRWSVVSVLIGEDGVVHANEHGNGY